MQGLLGLSEVFDVGANSEDLIGELTEAEALEACGEMGIAVTAGEVTLAEMHAALRSHLSEMKKNPRAVFDELDADKSGSLSREEVRQAAAMLGFLMSAQQAADAFAEMDGDASGEIDFDEFNAWFRTNVAGSVTQLRYMVADSATGPQQLKASHTCTHTHSDPHALRPTCTHIRMHTRIRAMHYWERRECVCGELGVAVGISLPVL